MKLLSLIICSLTAGIGNQWGLKECIEYALENNFSILESYIDVKEAGSNLESSYLSLVPSLSLGAGYEFTEGTLSATASATYSLNGTLEGGIGIALAKSDAKIASVRHGLERDRIILSVLEAYMNILLCKELVTIAESGYDSALSMKREVEALVIEGRRAESSLTEIESQVTGEMVNVVTCKSNLRIEREKLRLILSLPYGESAEGEFDIRGEEFSSEEMVTSEEMISQDYGDPASFMYYNESMKIPALQLKQRELTYKMSFLASLPRVGIGFVWYPASPQNRYFNISLTLPIIDSGRCIKSINKARLERERAELKLRSQEEGIKSEIIFKMAELFDSRQEYLAATSEYEAAAENGRIATERFREGLISTREYSIEMNRLTEAESNMTRARYVMLFRKKVLDYYRDKSIY